MNKNLFALVLLAACGGKTDFVGGDDDGDDTGGTIVCDGLPKVTHEDFGMLSRAVSPCSRG